MENIETSFELLSTYNYFKLKFLILYLPLSIFLANYLPVTVTFISINIT